MVDYQKLQQVVEIWEENSIELKTYHESNGISTTRV